MERRTDKRNRESAETQLLKELKKCVSDERFADALAIIDQIDVNRIKVAPNLCLIGEVYMHEGMYEDAERVFVRAYDKTPSNRRILNLLTSLYIEMGDYGEAEYYYKEFIGVATRDLNRYILRYRLDRAKGERTAVLIDTLERLKDYEYMEEWAYELAELYHKSGDDKKAVHECDEIVLWFGHGEYVNKAVRLKCEITGEAIPVFDADFMSAYDGQPAPEEEPVHTGLTDTAIDVELIEKALKAQEEKQQQFREKQEKYVSSEDLLAAAKTQNIPTEEIAKSADEDDFFDSFEDGKADAAAQMIEADMTEENIPIPEGYGIYENPADAVPGEQHLEDQVPADQMNAQVQDESAVNQVPEEPQTVSSIFDALSTDTTMDFWGEKERRKPRRLFKKRSVEEIEQEQRAAEIKKSQLAHLQAHEDAINKLLAEDEDDDFDDEVIETSNFSEDILSEDDFEDEVIENGDMTDSLFGDDDFAESLFGDDDFDDEGEAVEDAKGKAANDLDEEDDLVDEAVSNLDETDEFADEAVSDLDEADEFADETVSDLDAGVVADADKDDIEDISVEDVISKPLSGGLTMQNTVDLSKEQALLEDIIEVSLDDFEADLPSDGQFKEELFEDDLDDDDFEDEIIVPSKPSTDNVELIMDEDDIVEERVWTEEDKTFINGLFDSSKTSSNVFAQVPNIDYVKEQLTKTFTKFEENETASFDILAAYDINFVVLADDKSVKSQIALGIAKALNTYGKCDKTKIVRAKSKDLNDMDFSSIFDKIKGGCLIIEKADLLSDASVKIIEDYVNQDKQETAIVFASVHDEMMKFWKKHQTLRSKFLNVINVSKYNEMELVTLAKGYIEQRKYEMDPEAALVLRDYFKKCLEDNVEVNYEDVMGIVDMAISNLEKRNMKNLFMTVLDNKYEEAKMFNLLAEDFGMLNE